MALSIFGGNQSVLFLFHVCVLTPSLTHCEMLVVSVNLSGLQLPHCKIGVILMFNPITYGEDDCYVLERVPGT